MPWGRLMDAVGDRREGVDGISDEYNLASCALL